MAFPTASPRVVSLGVHIVDVLGRPVTGIPPGQHNIFLDEIRVTAAGTAAGASVDLAKLGADVVAMGAVGDDQLADFLVLLMSRYGIDTSHLARKQAAQTSSTMLPIRPNGERPALHVPGASPLLTIDDVDLAVVAGADALHVGAPDVLERFTRESLGRVLEVAKANGVLVTVDLLYAGEPATLELLRPLLPMIDYFMPNAEQLCAIAEVGTVDAAITKVRSICPTTVIVKMGAEGSLLAGDGPAVHIPALPIEVVDTTGCGDAYCAGFIIGLARGWDPVAAAWLGAASGALVATGLGSDAGIVDFPTTAAFLSQAAAGLTSVKAPAEILLPAEATIQSGGGEKP
jgi:sugar/nucleoside kinase (ribokinase family)